MWFNFGRWKALYAWRWWSVSIEVTALREWFSVVAGNGFIWSCFMIRERFLEIVSWIRALLRTLGGGWVTWGTLGENFFAVWKAGACDWISSGVGMFVRERSNRIGEKIDDVWRSLAKIIFGSDFWKWDIVRKKDARLDGLEWTTTCVLGGVRGHLLKS